MGNLAPRLVCLTWAQDLMHPGITVRAHGDDEIRSLITNLCDPEIETVRVAHNLSFDLAVMARECPDLLPNIFLCIERGRFRCTKVREKLLRLATTGDLEYTIDSFGKPRSADYSLAGLVKYYFNEDISASKEGEDAWRTNFDVLEPMPLENWPEEAVKYAQEDSVWAKMILRAQEERRQTLIFERGIDPFIVQDHRVMFDFCLHLVSCRGVRIDNDEKRKVQAKIDEALDPSNFTLLYERGILRPPVLPKAKRNGEMTQGKKESKNLKVLRDFVLSLAQQYPDDVKLRYTDPSPKFPDGQLSVDSEFLDDHAHLCKELELLRQRESLQKIATTELPRMCIRDEDQNPIADADIVHPMFDSIKATGRSSSMASKLLPSFNGQNVHPLVRPCYIPRDGYLLFSIDYSYMELCTFAQACHSIFGYSKLAEIINAGADPHAWLGSMLASRVDQAFGLWVADTGTDPYSAFMSLKGGNDEQKAYFKKWRNMAKPTGLGFPGGLSPKTMVAFAKATYHVEMSEELATECREAWFDALPEARAYLREWVPDQGDPWNTITRKRTNRQTGEEEMVTEQALGYFSPFGMHRAGADYCAVANGKGLQTWSGDGFLAAFCAVVRLTHDYSLGHPLLGKVHPLIPIHDEIVGEVLDDGNAGEYATQVAEIMVENFSTVLPDVKIKAQPVLMRRWDKNAEPVFDSVTKKLIPWEPTAK